PLEHCSRTSRPGHLAFFFRGLLTIVHVCRGLRQDVMELVSKTLERKSFFEELSDARGAEQEDAEDLIVPPGRIDQFRGGIIEFWRGIHIGELVLFIQTHRHAKVVLTEEKD